ncbi:hypothetical protein V502_03400, partial [Pseudogymnoascus sp. VKM F-4520 (FW-2644)]
MASKDTFPFILGHDAAGTIVAVGSGFHDLKVGDEVFTRVPNHLRGTIAEYCISSASATARKPAFMTFVDTASIPLVGLAVLQVMRRADADLDGGLKGPQDCTEFSRTIAHGWFAVKNRSTKEIQDGVTMEQRHINEKKFFETVPFNQLSKDR